MAIILATIGLEHETTENLLQHITIASNESLNKSSQNVLKLCFFLKIKFSRQQF